MNPCAINKSCTIEIYSIWYIFIEHRVKQERGCGRNSPGGGKRGEDQALCVCWRWCYWYSLKLCGSPREAPETRTEWFRVCLIIGGVRRSSYLSCGGETIDRANRVIFFRSRRRCRQLALKTTEDRPANVTDVELSRPLWNHVNGSWGWEIIFAWCRFLNIR